MAALMVSSFGMFVMSFFADLFTVASGQTLIVLACGWAVAWGEELVIGELNGEEIGGLQVLRERCLAIDHLHEEAQSQVGPIATHVPTCQTSSVHSRELGWPRES